MKIKDIMIRDVTSVLATCKLVDLISILSRRKITGLPVVNNNQEVVGYISLHDIIDSILSEFIQLSKSLKEYSQRPIEEFMRKNIVTIDEDDNEVLASDLLIRNKIQRLPVLRDGKLMGIITLTDICRVLMEKNENNENEG